MFIIWTNRYFVSKALPEKYVSFAKKSCGVLWESIGTNCYCKMRNWKGETFMIYLIVVQTFDTRPLLNFTVGY